MKLTKVLVGLIAISLCGMATAAVKKGMSGADMRAGFLAAVKKNDDTRANEFLNALKGRADWVYYGVMIAGDLGAMKNGAELIEKYDIKSTIPTRTPDEGKKPAPGPKPEPKGAVWDAAWGTTEPDWNNFITLNEIAQDATSAMRSFKAGRADGDDKVNAQKAVFAYDNRGLNNKSKWPAEVSAFYDGFKEAINYLRGQI